MSVDHGLQSHTMVSSAAGSLQSASFRIHAHWPPLLHAFVHGLVVVVVMVVMVVLMVVVVVVVLPQTVLEVVVAFAAT